MKKIVFFDIDGTLLDFDKNLPESTKKAIKQLQDNGVYVAIATGRSPFMFEKLREELDISSYVSFNGQYVVFENELIYSNPINKEALHRLSEQAKEREVPLVYMDEQTMKGTVEYSKNVEISFATFTLPHPEFDEHYFKENDIYQTLLYCSEEDEKYYLENNQDVRFIRWHPVCMDVVPGGGSKAVGIQHFIERAGFEMKNVYAFGDGLNDIEMIQTVGTGIVMGNAEEELKPHADLLTTSVDDDGIYNALVKLGLIE
ncbi:Cof-type HAD-IIB family hydrolase [Bacillus massiliigorillae]|uniref:Cof-type HAD-IIB family hydrolase n=1 Tax=Bacillus massiliigorillae TaxID=1243664 RepID=UPI0003A2F139|nr:Cof-type HAD-IIB family hydrolase [Bacillus massiliigorillae]